MSSPPDAKYVHVSCVHVRSAIAYTSLIDYAITHNLTPFISMQNHYSLIYREEEREMFPTLEVRPCHPRRRHCCRPPSRSSFTYLFTAVRRGLDPMVAPRPRAARAPRRHRLGDDTRKVGQVDLAAPDRRRGRHPPEVRRPPLPSLSLSSPLLLFLFLSPPSSRVRPR